jgi:nicotinamidase/pyrazinamidase
MSFPKNKIASFDVDAQNGFTPICPNELPVVGGDQIAPELNFMATLAGFRVGSKDAHSPQAPWIDETGEKIAQPTGLPNADLFWPVHCVPGTLGYELLDTLPAETDYGYMVYKGVSTDLHPYGACYHDLHNKLTTGAIEVLRCNGIEKVLVGGLALDYCVKTTVLQLLAADFIVVLHLPACRAISAEGALEALVEMVAAGAVIAHNQDELTKFANEGN